jgi:hypothetical protein
MAGKPSDADLLSLPKIPKPKKDDPEDVAWALSTAEAMWSRAENADAIKWIRRAAEAASEAEADDRALELAKAAADLASMLVRVENPDAGPTPSAPPPMSAERPPNTLQSQAPPPPPPPPPPPAQLQNQGPPPPNLSPVMHVAPSRPPPAPVVAMTPRAPSVAPPRAPSVAPPRNVGGPQSGSQAGPPSKPSAPAKAPTPARAVAPQAALQKVTHSRAGERRRRSSHNLSDEARRAAQAEIISRAGGEQEVTKPHGMDIPIPKPAAARRRSRPSPTELGPDPTEVISRPAPQAAAPAPAPVPAPPAAEDKHDTDPPPPPAHETNPRLSHAEEADQWPTQSLTSASDDDLGGYDENQTRIGTPAYTPSGRRPVDAPADGLRASQAVRVIVWRGPDGVHVAPAGTKVSAITVDALLVALDPNADLTAWLKG